MARIKGAMMTRKRRNKTLKMLAKGPPKKDKNGNIMKDKSGKVVHEP